MQVTKQIAVELLDGGNVPPIVYAKQNDSQTRFVAVSLYENGQPFEPPDGVLAEFRAKKPDGTACFYDVNEDGEPAIVIEGSVVTAELAEQVLTAAGKVYAEINLYSSAGAKLTTFSFVIIVEPSVLTDAEIVSSDYYNILSAQIEAAQTAAQTAQSSAAAAAAEADRAKGYADSINPSQFVKTVNGEEPDSNGNVEVQAGVASVFGRTGAVTAQDGDYDAGQIDETSSRVFVSPQEKAKWNIPGDLINGTLSVWQRYNADDSTTYTNPDELYIADRFSSNGTGTVKPNARGYGADITGTVTMQYWMEKSDFALLPDPVVVYYSVGGGMQSTSTAKTSVPTDSDGNACIFSRAITNQTLDWVSLYPGRPVRPYAEELALCQRYAVIYRVKNGSTFLFPGYGISETSFRFTAQLPTPMRTKPTVTGTSLTAGASAPDEQSHNLSGVTVAADAGNTLMVQGTTSGLTAGRLYFLRIPNGGYMLLDAEIY